MRVPALNFHQLEIFFPGAAFWACPVDRDIGPEGAGRYALFGQAGFFVINPSADEAHPSLIFHSSDASFDDPLQYKV